MTILFIASFYFSGMPIFVPIVFVAFFFKYFIEKFIICYSYSKIYLNPKINTSKILIQVMFGYIQ